ncbi:MAG: DUF1538 domain-containing protein [Clostridiales bacterium]|nr:DUF1538 domain-containing protein [Clostridiales bacterium]
MKDLLSKLYESFLSVLPISIIVVALGLVLPTIKGIDIGLFLMGAILVMIGMTLFSLGADIAMLTIGNSLGSVVSKNKKLIASIAICLVIGLIITLAEPDLHVLSEQLASKAVIYSVAIGVGMFLVISLLRVVFAIKLKYILLISYSLIFILALFVPNEYLGIALDSGGVTTGPITVPFLVSFGIGLAAVREGNSDHDNSFGLIALCSTGPILAILVFGLINKSPLPYVVVEIPPVDNFGEMIMVFLNGFLPYIKEVGIALAPIVVVFFIFQFVVLKLPKMQVIRIIIGLLYTFVGLTLFLTGVYVGFMPIGATLGNTIAGSIYKWWLVPIGLIIGLVIVFAEPAVHVLTKQVADITAGSISRKSMLISLALGVSVSLALSMVRVLSGISIWYFVLPVYIAAVVLTFIAPPIFSGIAFDSGGVAAGSMASAFLLPMGIGASVALDGNVLTDAFGLVGFVAMTPLVTIQLLGLIYKYKDKAKKKDIEKADIIPQIETLTVSEYNQEVIDFDEVAISLAKESEKDSEVDNSIAIENEKKIEIDDNKAKESEKGTEVVETSADKEELVKDKEE